MFDKTECGLRGDTQSGRPVTRTEVGTAPIVLIARQP
jgi:hypothetical protein